MKSLATLKDKDLFPESLFEISHVAYQDREAARAIVFDAHKNIALLHVTKHGYFKLPGGGIEKGEDAIAALKRECKEEIGCEINVQGEVGEILEFRDQHILKQLSYCYIAEVLGGKGDTNMEKGEIADGFELIWVGLDKAIQMAKDSKPDIYGGKFMATRDLMFMEEARKLFNASPSFELSGDTMKK